MQGSTVYQFLWDQYSAVAQQATQTVVGTILPIVSAGTIAVLHLYIVLWGISTANGEMSAAEFGRRFARLYLVVALMSAATFNAQITTTLTQTIPDMIGQAIGGQANLTGAQGFDAENNQITRFSASLRAQMTPPIFYIGNLVAVWLVETACKGLNGLSFSVWALARMVVYFVVPLLALIGWLFLFKKTQHFVEAALGKIVSLFLIQALALMVAAVTVTTTAVWFDRYGATIAAQTPNQNLQMAGDNGALAFSAFTGNNENIPGGGAPQANPTNAQTINVDSSLEVMLNLVVVLAFGFVLLGSTTVIAYSIGGGGGMNISAGVMAAGNAIGRSVEKRLGRRR